MKFSIDLGDIAYESVLWAYYYGGILMIGACALKAYKKEGALARVVFLYELGAFICGIIFLVYTYVPGTTITVLCKGLIMASFDWLLILLMYYTSIIQACLRALWV